MRHKKSGRQFGRDTSSRRAMLRNLAANLITHERIETTDAKAKELRRVAERLISKALRLGKVAYTPHADLNPAEKAKRLHTERLVGAYVPRWGVTTDGAKIDIIGKVMVDLSKRFEGRAGGYTRITKLGPRRGDGAPMSIIEFIDAAAPVDKVLAAPEEPSAAEPADAASTTEASTTEASAGEASAAGAEGSSEAPSEGA